MEIGEYAVGAYLKFVEHCDYVLYNQSTEQEQGEMDIIAIRNPDSVVFVCEAAFHLRGLRYSRRKAGTAAEESARGVSARRVIDRVSDKFRRASSAISKIFPDHEPRYQFWTMKSRPGINQLWDEMCDQLGLKVEFIHGTTFAQKMQALREEARTDTSHVDNPFYRTLQILEQSGTLSC